MKVYSTPSAKLPNTTLSPLPPRISGSGPTSHTRFGQLLPSLPWGKLLTSRPLRCSFWHQLKEHAFFTGVLQAFLISPFQSVIRLFRKRTELIGQFPWPWQTLKGIPKKLKLCLAQATYNVTKDAAALNKVLPYRRGIQANPAKLKQYEALIAYFNKNYELSQSPHTIGKLIKIIDKPLTKDFDNIMENTFKQYPDLYQKAKEIDLYVRNYTLLHQPLTFLKLIFLKLFTSPAYFKKASFRITEKIYKKLNIPKIKIDLQRIKEINQKIEFQLDKIRIERYLHQKKPVTDTSFQYLIPSKVVELFHNRPEVMAKVFKNQYKLHIGLSQSSGLNNTLGFAYNYFNFISSQKRSVIQAMQHEFVHRASVVDKFHITDKIPGLSASQAKEFETIQITLRKMFEQNEDTFWGRLKVFFTGKTSTGIRNYAFHPKEFLTVTLDTFMEAPKKLCKTEPGRKLYDLYKNYFKLDPLNGYKDLV